MDEHFDMIRAPQFISFEEGVSGIDDHADDFFECNTETSYYFDSAQIDERFCAANGQTTVCSNDAQSNYESEHPLRKSISVGNLDIIYSLSKHVEVMEIRSQNTENNSNQRETHLEPKRTERTNHCKISRVASVDNLSRKNNTKFISVAEAVFNFQNKTPVRFRKSAQQYLDHLKPLQKTVPYSPALITKLRARPHHVLTHEEREILEFNNQQQFKIKANPLNQRVLHGPIKPTVPVQKKATIPEPFNLSAPPKKVVAPSPKREPFHSRPAPRTTPRQVITSATKKCTEPKTPNCLKKFQEQQKAVRRKLLEPCVKKQTTNVERPNKTNPEPFSFSDRDQMMFKKKEDTIKKILEDEKKAREFHANPVPKFAKKKSSSITSLESSGSTQAKNESTSVQFKAKPATVLDKDPFVPVKIPKPLLEIKNIQLNTATRMEERIKFNQMLKSQEQKLNSLRENEEKLRQEREAEEIARLRKEAEFKAEPIKKYKPIEIQQEHKMTVPIAPRCLSHSKREKNKENVNESC